MRRREFLAAAMLPATGARAKARPFPLGAVRLSDGPMLAAERKNGEYLRSLEPDRLLHTFRLTAGLPTSAQPLGGWEKPDVELRGHFAGHYLTACAQMAAQGDAELKARGEAVVEGLARCQAKMGSGYLNAFPVEFFERLRDGKKVWAPWYTTHKILAGLLDMHRLAGSRQALDVADGMAAWAVKWNGAFSDEQMNRQLEVEFGGMNDVLYNLSGATGNAEYAKLAHRFDHPRVFEFLAASRDELKGLHANTTIPKIIGAARRYELTGETKYRDIAEFFWKQVVEYRSYCTGGTSNFEHWRTGPGQLAAELSTDTQECCCTYNMLKLTRQLFAWTAEAKYADYTERAMWNGIMGTMNPANGLTMYFVPLASGYWKVFGEPMDSFWCCTGTGVESFSKLADSVYFHDDDSLYVNLFAASRVEWREKGIAVRQETEFPEQEGTSLVVEARDPVRFAMRVRAPGWAEHGIAVKLDGKTTKASKGYCTIDRVWKNGDRVEVSTPMSLRAEAMPDDAGLQAFLYGPLVLAGELGKVPPEMQRDPSKDPVENHYAKGKPAVAPVLRAEGKHVSAWMRRVAGTALAFETPRQARDVIWTPFYKVIDQRYAIYWRVRNA